MGRGAVIGGRVTLRLAPDALRELAAGRRIVLVTGTNGKSTTTRMLVEALAGDDDVATNREGANMGAGLVAALGRRLDTPLAVLEVDELHLPTLAAQLRPAALIMLNLSRDQLDRMTEVRTVARQLRKAVAEVPGVTVIANADDVLVTAAASAAAVTVWVQAGSTWTQDAASCPLCGGVVTHHSDNWACTSCSLRRPQPDLSVTEDAIVSSEGWQVPMHVSLPGAVNRGNAAMAVAAARMLGVDSVVAAERVSQVREVDGRYRTVRRGARDVTLLLAKNPAGWREALTMVDPSAGHVVVALNGQGPDGRDLSWLWDVDFERLRDWPVTASGESCTDLAVRLTYADLPHLVREDPVRAIDEAPPGRITVLANYTAFQTLRSALLGSSS